MCTEVGGQRLEVEDAGILGCWDKTNAGIRTNAGMLGYTGMSLAWNG